MLLLDQGLPRSATLYLREKGMEAIHTGDAGLTQADDATILEQARREAQIVVTLDADFHRLLALSNAAAPSVIRIRIEGLRAEELAELLVQTIAQCAEDLRHGALVTVTETGIRLRHLPLLR